MDPRTLHRMGTISIIVGVTGLAIMVVLFALVAAGATESPQTIMAAWVPIQSVINIGLGWSLRRRAAELSR